MEHELSTPSEIMDKIESNISTSKNGCHIWRLGISQGNPNIIWTNTNWEHVNVDVRKWVWLNKHGSIDPDAILIQNEKCHDKCCNVGHMEFQWDKLTYHL